MASTLAATNAATFDNDESRWQAVVERDARADGVFYYAVASTGIFCRPTCPSRRPTRERVTFFESQRDARQSGFRPCKRCHPEDLADSERFVQKVVQTIESWEGGRPTLADLAAAVGLSPSHLQRKFKRATGISPAEYARQRRIDRFRDELKEGQDVTTSIYESGFESSASLYESANRELGMTPASYRAGGKGQEIRYVTGDSPLGRLLLAYTDRGVASIQIGDDDDGLLRSLASEFPEADIEPSDEQHPWFQVVLDYLSGDIPHPELPLDIQGTAFQRRVWQAIRVIPPGETRSYSEIAVEIGSPDAARAVAQACARNRVAMVIPCHRVVRSDGGHGGYRWGEDRKAALIALETGE